jgi:hypothetical protein
VGLTGRKAVNGYLTGSLFPTVRDLSDYEDAALLAQFRAALVNGAVARIKDQVRELTFASCRFAASAGAQRVLDAIRDGLGIDRVVAPRKWLLGNFNRLERTGPWVVYLAAYEGGAEPDVTRPVKGATSQSEVLYISVKP